MKILWIINIQLPEVANLQGKSSTIFGGWLVKSSELLSNYHNIDLYIASPQKNVQKFTITKGKKIIYYNFPIVNHKNYKSQKLILEFNEIIKDINPDIVHIHGTELYHSYLIANILIKENIRFVISLQGIVSRICKHLYADLPFSVIYFMTFRNFILKDSIFLIKKRMEKNSVLEIELFTKSKYVIGRTLWDKVCVKQYNPNIEYFKSNEILRDSFYTNRWNYNNCQKHTIFCSQANYSLKGVHYVIKALYIIKKNYPNVLLYISGKNITKLISFKDYFYVSYYGFYLNRLIKKLNLSENIIFTGELSENEMVRMFLKSNVFVSSSTIENSPNSLCESMILGVPSIASFVGGVESIIDHMLNGILYQHNEYTMLANHIMELFSNKELASFISNNAVLKAQKTHNQEENIDTLVNIYKKIIS